MSREIDAAEEVFICRDMGAYTQCRLTRIVAGSRGWSGRRMRLLALSTRLWGSAAPVVRCEIEQVLFAVSIA
jgi:hypothetical protein